MDAPTNVPAETAVAITIEATIAPSGMKMIFETSNKTREIAKIFIFSKTWFSFICSCIGI